MKQKNNDVNIFNYPAKKYSSYIFDVTKQYQKQYGFNIGTGTHATWNNEADAFKHTYMQAQLALWTGKHAAKMAGDFHEWQGNKSMGQSSGEENMDNWNNAQGRDIAKEIIREYGVSATIPSKKTNDIIAKKIMERMKNGQLITTPKDNRKYKPGKPTGFAAPVTQSFTPEQVGKMSREEFDKNESAIMHQIQTGTFNQTKPKDLSGYRNSHTGDDRIYTAEDIGSFSSSEFSQHEPAINAQMSTIGIPTNNDMKNSSGTVYVAPYTRSDGVKVSGYYRSK